jgi:hypothetical protein
VRASRVAAQVPGKTKDQCYEKHYEGCDQSISASMKRKAPSDKASKAAAAADAAVAPAAPGAPGATLFAQ